MLLRIIDVILSVLALFLSMPIILILIFLGLIDTGSPFFIQIRIGRLKKPFPMIKFRTMKKETLSVPTHLADSSDITNFGKFLRKSKLDELPQLWNVIKGEMSIVGPRPCLPTQLELIKERELHGVFEVRPGITGLSQVNAIDMSTPQLLAETDAKMIEALSFITYCKLILMTIRGEGFGDRMR